MLTLLKRVRGLQALSVALSYLDFNPGLVKVRLHPRPGYVPKVPFSTIHPVILQAFLLSCLTYLSKKGFLSCVQSWLWGFKLTAKACGIHLINYSSVLEAMAEVPMSPSSVYPIGLLMRFLLATRCVERLCL